MSKTKYLPVAVCFVALVVQGISAYAQAYDRLIVHAGDSLCHHYSYLFPSFGNAMVKFRDGRSFVYQMDFNLLTCDMQYIKNGDTLAITNPADIDSIEMETTSFFYDYKKGYFQVDASSDAGKLVIYRRTVFEPVQIGGMGESRQSGGVEMINMVTSRQGPMPLVLNQDIYVVRKTTYFVMYPSGEMEKAGKAAFMRLYNGDKKTFAQFVEKNKINYNEEGDLEKLFQFCTHSKM